MKEGGEARSSEGGGGRRRAKVQGWSWMEEKSRGVEGGRLQTARRRRNETGGTGRKEAEKGEERGRKREEKQTGTRPKRKPQNSLFANRESERITKCVDHNKGKPSKNYEKAAAGISTGGVCGKTKPTERETEQNQ